MKKILKSFTALPQAPTLAFIGGVCFMLFVGIGMTFYSSSSLAGSLSPTAAPLDTMYTLTDIYNLSTGATTTVGSGSIPATPGSATSTMKTFTEVYTALATEISELSSILASGTTAFGQVGGVVIPFQLLKTGQSTCWDANANSISCTNTGQDGALQKGMVRSYTDNADGTILDNSTGLTWQKGTTTTYTWANALAYCNNNTAGLPGSGWRLPQIKELFSLIDFSVFSNYTPCINTTYFPGTSFLMYWSATTYPVTGSQNLALGLYMGGGYSDLTDKTTSQYVRCVRD